MAITQRAYEIWEQRGLPKRANFDDWLQAERELYAVEFSPDDTPEPGREPAKETPLAGG